MKREILIKKRGSQSQQEIANKLNITQKHLSKIELGERNPSVILLSKFCFLYNESAENLFPDIFLKQNTTL